jgi:hypothetical protein
MRGGAQAHLIEADDGHWYVTKFVNNPQGGRRILVNELITSLLFSALDLSTPEPALVLVDQEFLRANPEVHIASKPGPIALEPGVHFGSRYPGSPVATAVYDFLPDTMISQVVNRDHFLGTLVADKWVSNADARQSIYFRAQLRYTFRGTGISGVGWMTEMIDHGMAFQGNDWTFGVSAVQGLYQRRIVYGHVSAMADFEPWLERLLSLGRDVLDSAFMVVPPDWIRGDELQLHRLLRQLYSRRVLVPQLVAASIEWLQRRSPSCVPKDNATAESARPRGGPHEVAVI